MGKCKRQTETEDGIEDGIEDGMVAGFGEADAVGLRHAFLFFIFFFFFFVCVCVCDVCDVWCVCVCFNEINTDKS